MNEELGYGTKSLGENQLKAVSIQEEGVARHRL